MVVKDETSALGIENGIDRHGSAQIGDRAAGVAQCHANDETAAQRRADEVERSSCSEKADLLGRGMDFLDQGRVKYSLVQVVRESMIAQIQTDNVIPISN